MKLTKKQLVEDLRKHLKKLSASSIKRSFSRLFKRKKYKNKKQAIDSIVLEKSRVNRKSLRDYTASAKRRASKQQLLIEQRESYPFAFEFESRRFEYYSTLILDARFFPFSDEQTLLTRQLTNAALWRSVRKFVNEHDATAVFGIEYRVERGSESLLTLESRSASFRMYSPTLTLTQWFTDLPISYIATIMIPALLSIVDRYAGDRAVLEKFYLLVSKELQVRRLGDFNIIED